MTLIRTTKANAYTVEQWVEELPADGESAVYKGVGYAVHSLVADEITVRDTVAYLAVMTASGITVNKSVAYALHNPPAESQMVNKATGTGTELRWPMSGMWYRTQAGDWVSLVPYGCLGDVRITQQLDRRITEEGDRRTLDGEGVWVLVDTAYGKRIETVWGQMYPMEPDPNP